MKRILIVLTLLVGAVGTAPMARAASPHATARQVQTGVIHSANDLRIPLSSTYPPPGFSTTTNTAVAPADADTNTLQGIFLHATMPYRNLGVLGMWYQEFRVQYADNLTAYLSYLGSYYTSPDAARAALNDVVASGSFRSVQQCQFAGAEQCLDVQIGGLVDANTPYTDHWRIVQVSNAVMESGYLIPSPDFQINQATLESILNDMTTAFLNTVKGVNNNPPPTPVTPQPTPVTPQPTPVTPKPTPVTPKPTPVTPVTTPVSQVSWELLGVHVEKNGAKANYQSKSLTKAKAGKKMQLTVYIGIHSAPAGTPVAAQVLVTKGKKVVFKSKVAGGDLQQDTTQVAVSVHFTYTFKGSGTMTVVGVAKVGDTQAQQAQVKVKVT